jgi:hypothetical protein
MRWAGHAVKREKCTWFCCGSLEERDHSEDHGTDGRMGSEWILGRWLRGDVEWIQLAVVNKF